jgi:DNA uptake protein ComE-like DNA-binding protein
VTPPATVHVVTPLNPPKRRSWPAIAASWLLVAAPLVSLGALTGPAFAFAAVRMRSRWVGLSAGIYVALAVTMATTAGAADGSPADATFGAALAVNTLGAATHALIIRGRVARGHEAPPPQPDPIVARAIAQRDRRRQARTILANDPQLALELGIGRPDLPRQYDDGGLVDVNHVPAELLAGLPGMTTQLAERIMAARGRPLGLSSVEDLVVYAGIPPDVVEPLRDLLVFRP